MIKGPLKLTITGPQGAGKTQLLNIIEGILKVFGYNTIINDEENTIEIIKKD